MRNQRRIGDVLGRAVDFNEALEGVCELVSQWLARRRQRVALMDLVEDPHLLKDIGKTCRDALQECRKPFWQ